MLLYFAVDSFHNTLESMCTCTFVMLIFHKTAEGLCILFVLWWRQIQWKSRNVKNGE